MIEPTEADIGRKVIYHGGAHPGAIPEEGIITSFNAYAVFVRYLDAATVRPGRRWHCRSASLSGVLDYGETLEVTRVCVVGHAPLGTCSFLYMSLW